MERGRFRKIGMNDRRVHFVEQWLEVLKHDVLKWLTLTQPAGRADIYAASASVTVRLGTIKNKAQQLLLVGLLAKVRMG